MATNMPQRLTAAPRKKGGAFTLHVGGKTYDARRIDARCLFCCVVKLRDGRWAVVHIDHITHHARTVARGMSQRDAMAVARQHRDQWCMALGL